MSAGEGALMEEIDQLKKSRDESQEQNTLVGNELSKCRLEHKKSEREKGDTEVKLRETGQNLYNAKRETEKYKTKYDTLEMAHTTTTERYRDVSSKEELCGDRLREAKIKHSGCENAMERMKVTYNDQNNQQKRELVLLREQKSQAEQKVSEMQMSNDEKSRADALAKQATETAVGKALETAQAKSLAVTTNAQDAVDKAAKEAVTLANQAANAGNTATGATGATR